MRPLTWVGAIIMVLGILAFVVPVRTSKTHELRAEGASVDITTHHTEKLSPVVGGLICVAGAALMIVGMSKAGA
jgi:hypothetical protein